MDNNKYILVNKLSVFLLALITLLFVCCAPEQKAELPVSSTSAPDNDVRTVFNNYKTAVMNGNGAEASRFVSSQTIQYYNTLLDLVLTADSSKLMLNSLLDKFTVLAIRQTVDWGSLRAMDGKALFIYAIQNGMIGKDAIKASIGKVELKNESLAMGELIVNGSSTNIYTDFIREDGVWRVNLLTLLKENEKSLKKMIEQPGVSEGQSVIDFFKKTFGVAPSREIWLPVKFYNK